MPMSLPPPSLGGVLGPYATIEDHHRGQRLLATLGWNWCFESAAVLVHCGAGVSRSATLCIAYLMRKFNWPAERARAHCIQRRSIVMPNDGFWRSLCAFEGQLGIQQRQVSSRFQNAATAPSALDEISWNCFGSMLRMREVVSGGCSIPLAADKQNELHLGFCQ